MTAPGWWAEKFMDLQGIPSAEAFGTLGFSIPGDIFLPGIASAQAFGTMSIGSRIALTGIPSAQAFGTMNLNQNVSLTGIASAEAFGTLKVSPVIGLTGIGSAETFGAMSIAAHLSDSFNRADSLVSLGASWTNRVQNMGIFTNRAGGATGGLNLATYNTPLNTNDQQVNLVLGDAIAADDSVYAIIGANTSGECAICRWYQGDMAIYSVTGWFGFATRATSISATFSTGNTLSFRRIGNVYTGLKNGTPIAGLTWTDSGDVVPRDTSHRTPGIGAYNQNSTRTIDSWSADDIPN